jgi:superfamily II DNA or RNA helicase
MALTATPDRKDGRTSLLTNYFGHDTGEVKGTNMKPLACSAYVVNTDCRAKAKPFGNTVMQIGMLTTAVAADKRRNRLIASIVMRGYEAGRHILVLSDRIEQLKTLRRLLQIPKSEMGLFISAASQERLNLIKSECAVILATYGMMKEGQDIPRLDMGVDATPRSEGVQAIGRIRRRMPGKRRPIWVTLFDSNGSSLLQGISGARIKDYKACGVDVVNVGSDLGRIPF